MSTRKECEQVARLMARALNQNPDAPLWTRAADGSNVATVGAVFYTAGSTTNGIAHGIAQIVNDAGGQRTLLRARTARELLPMAHAWLDGFSAALHEIHRKLPELDGTEEELDLWHLDQVVNRRRR